MFKIKLQHVLWTLPSKYIHVVLFLTINISHDYIISCLQNCYSCLISFPAPISLLQSRVVNLKRLTLTMLLCSKSPMASHFILQIKHTNLYMMDSGPAYFSEVIFYYFSFAFRQNHTGLSLLLFEHQKLFSV